MSVQPGFGRRLRQERLRRGLNQTQLSGEDLSASYISLLESGRREPTRATVERLADTLGVDADALQDGVSAQDAARDAMDLAHARLLLGQGQAKEAVELLEALTSRGAFGQDQTRAVELRLAHAEALERRGSLKDAVRLLEQLRVQAELAPRDLPWLPVMVALSRCYRESGDLRRAADVAEAALTRCEELGLVGATGHAELVATLSAAYYERGDHLRATVLLEELLESTEEAPRVDRAAAHWNAAVMAAERGEVADALRLAEGAADLLAEGGAERAVARLKVTRAWILLAQDPPRAAEAREMLVGALPDLVRYAEPASVGGAHVELARCALALDDLAGASVQALAALEQLGEDHPVESARASAVLGEALLRQGEPEQARVRLDQAAAALTGAGADRQAAAMWRRLGDLHLRLADGDSAMSAYRRALDAAGLPAAESATAGPL